MNDCEYGEFFMSNGLLYSFESNLYDLVLSYLLFVEIMDIAIILLHIATEIFQKH